MDHGGHQRSTDLNGANERLRHEIESLRINTGAQAAFLLNASGQLLLELGASRGVDPSILGMLVAGGMATTMEMAKVLREPQVSSLHFYRGRRHEIYASAVDEKHLVCLILEKYSQQSQIGIVWLYLKRALARIRHLLQAIDACRGEERALPMEDLQQALLQVWETEPTSQSREEPEPAEQDQLDDEGGADAPLYSYDEAARLGLIDQSEDAKGE